MNVSALHGVKKWKVFLHLSYSLDKYRRVTSSCQLSDQGNDTGCYNIHSPLYINHLSHTITKTLPLTCELQAQGTVT